MIEKIVKYKHIIWDWNGTLIDDIWLVVEIMNKMLKTQLAQDRFKKIQGNF